MYYDKEDAGVETNLVRPEFPSHQGELEIMQAWYDHIFPSAAEYMLDYDHIDDQVEYEPLNLEIQVDFFGVARSLYIPKKFEYLKPVLRTM